jgi:hypothetical protein
VPVWLRQEGLAYIAVLHGHCSVYHDASSEEEAVAGVLQLMYGYYCWPAFAQGSPDTNSAELLQLGGYLNKVFR